MEHRQFRKVANRIKTPSTKANTVQAPPTEISYSNVRGQPKSFAPLFHPSQFEFEFWIAKLPRDALEARNKLKVQVAKTRHLTVKPVVWINPAQLDEAELGA